jgi:hypothetical protein
MAKRIGYRYGNAVRFDEGARLDAEYADHSKSDRADRGAMLKLDLRAGDTLVLLRRGHLGSGPELPLIEAEVAKIGATVEIYEPAADHKAPGRPSPIKLSDEQWDRIREKWKDPVYWTQAAVLRFAETLAGRSVSRHQLIRKLGRRAET